MIIVTVLLCQSVTREFLEHHKSKNSSLLNASNKASNKTVDQKELKESFNKKFANFIMIVGTVDGNFSQNNINCK